ncbi:hypothetical protein N7495_002376 [Penicillium taxi]|uniref:uncharacterized protein n=1 Tax=Penicillium taxi TaxID=168475 RepID=UPI002544DD2E|nr:uncharacterized protein N7495_002376 [Penicillium taxi]KAJ5901848.1 hypothetical protein N7495_002376 [Penicillium taxi]
MFHNLYGGVSEATVSADTTTPLTYASANGSSMAPRWSPGRFLDELQNEFSPTRTTPTQRPASLLPPTEKLAEEDPVEAQVLRIEKRIEAEERKRKALDKLKALQQKNAELEKMMNEPVVEPVVGPAVPRLENTGSNLRRENNESHRGRVGSPKPYHMTRERSKTPEDIRAPDILPFEGRSLPEQQLFIKSLERNFAAHKSYYNRRPDSMVLVAIRSLKSPLNFDFSRYQKNIGHKLNWKEFQDWTKQVVAGLEHVTLSAARSWYTAKQLPWQRVRSFADHLKKIAEDMPEISEEHQKLRLFTGLLPAVRFEGERQGYGKGLRYPEYVDWLLQCEDVAPGRSDEIKMARKHWNGKTDYKKPRQDSRLSNDWNSNSFSGPNESHDQSSQGVKRERIDSNMEQGHNYELGHCTVDARSPKRTKASPGHLNSQ